MFELIKDVALANLETVQRSDVGSLIFPVLPYNNHELPKTMVYLAIQRTTSEIHN